MRKIWNEEEVQFITMNIASMSIREMAEHFNITYEKMNDKIHKMGLNRKLVLGKLWKKEDDEILAKHFQYAPKNYLMNIFPNRSWNAILQRGIKTLNLSRESQDRYFIDYNFFETWSNDSAYVFGVIAADGHLFYESGRMNKNALQFEMADYDRDILDKFKYVMKYEGPVLLTKRHTVKLQINNKKSVDVAVAHAAFVGNEDYSLIQSALIYLVYRLIKRISGAIQDSASYKFQMVLSDRYILTEVMKKISDYNSITDFFLYIYRNKLH